LTSAPRLCLSEKSCDDLAAVLERRDALGHATWRAGAGRVVKPRFAMEVFTEALLAGRVAIPADQPLLPLNRISATLAARRGVDPVALAALAMQVPDMTVVRGDEMLAFTHRDLGVCSVYHPGICWTRIDGHMVCIDGDEAHAIPTTILADCSGRPLSALLSHPDYDDLGLTIASAEPDELGASLNVEVRFDETPLDRSGLERLRDNRRGPTWAHGSRRTTSTV
jgi:hypothetical protein